MMRSDEDLNSLLSDKIDISLSTISSHNNVAKLKELLRQESRCHQETGDCYETLQREYDTLLYKYAEAENTIDKLRISAKIDSYSDGPNVNAFSTDNFHVRSKSVQQIPLARQEHAHMSRARSLPLQQDNVGNKLWIPEETVEASRLNLYLRLHVLQDDLAVFHSSLYDSEYDDNEKKQLYDVMKLEYEKVKTELESVIQIENTSQQNMSSKEYDPNSLEDQVHQLGLRLEEINDEIDEEIRSKQRKSQREELPLDTKVDGVSDESYLVLDDNNVFVEELPISNLDYCNGNQHNIWLPGTEDVTSSDYHNASASPSKVDHFNDKYLSRSLNAGDKNINLVNSKSLSPNSVTSWLHSEHNGVKNNNKVTENTGKTSYKRPLEVEPSSPERCTPQRKDLEVSNRPNTMNSTEDSGFVEYERQRRSPERVLFINNASEPLPQLAYNDDLSQCSANETYRRRLDSLKSFLHQQRNKALTSKPLKNTPRSWVRSVQTKTNAAPDLTSEERQASLAMDGRHTRVSIVDSQHGRSYKTTNDPSLPGVSHQQSLSRPHVRENSRHQTPNNSHGFWHHSPSNNSRPLVSYSPSSRLLYRPLNHSTGKKNYDKNDVAVCRDTIDVMYDEMKEIRDLVLDVHSSLHISTSPDPKSPHQKSSRPKSDTWTTKKTGSHDKQLFDGEKSLLNDARKTNCKKNQSFNQLNDETNISGLHDQLQHVNEKLDLLSSKLESKLSRSSSMCSLISQSTMRTSRRDPSNISNDGNAQVQKIDQLKELSNRIDELSIRTKTPDEGRNLISRKREEKDLLATVEKKLDELNKYVLKGSEAIAAKASTGPAPFPTSRESDDGDHEFETDSKTHNAVTLSGNRNSRSQEKLLNRFTSTPSHLSSNLHKTPDTNNNVFHHHHTFYHSSPQLYYTPSRKKQSDKGIQNRSSQERYSFESSNKLNDSITEASHAAHKMENLSRKILRNIAVDLFNSGPSEI